LAALRQGVTHSLVRLPDEAAKESRDRVSSALTNSGFKFPLCRSTINLAPGDVKKEGPSFDLLPSH
jgi:magnesium chelatase family protein